MEVDFGQPIPYFVLIVDYIWLFVLR